MSEPVMILIGKLQEQLAEFPSIGVSLYSEIHHRALIVAMSRTINGETLRTNVAIPYACMSFDGTGFLYRCADRAEELAEADHETVLLVKAQKN